MECKRETATKKQTENESTGQYQTLLYQTLLSSQSFKFETTSMLMLISLFQHSLFSLSSQLSCFPFRSHSVSFCLIYFLHISCNEQILPSHTLQSTLRGNDWRNKENFVYFRTNIRHPEILYLNFCTFPNITSIQSNEKFATYLCIIPQSNNFLFPCRLKQTFI
jgi:hypothetical protein